MKNVLKTLRLVSLGSGVAMIALSSVAQTADSSMSPDPMAALPSTYPVKVNTSPMQGPIANMALFCLAGRPRVPPMSQWYDQWCKMDVATGMGMSPEKAAQFNAQGGMNVLGAKAGSTANAGDAQTPSPMRGVTVGGATTFTPQAAPSPAPGNFGLPPPTQNWGIGSSPR